MQLRYVLTELGQGLRRNLSMHLAVVLTLFVSLTLVGLGLLLNHQSEKAAAHWGNQLQITVFLCKDRDPNPSCTAPATDAQKSALVKAIESNSNMKDYHFESREVAFEKLKQTYPPGTFDGPKSPVTVNDMPESYWITMKDPRNVEEVESQVKGLDGVAKVTDSLEVLKPIFSTLSSLKWGAIGTAAFLVLAALLLVANTIRLAAFARRKEIGIMRLVGASTTYIALPFLLEALVTAVIGILLAGGSLAAFMRFAIYDRVSRQVKFVPWVQWLDLWDALKWVAVLGVVLTIVPTLLLTRKYLKV